MRSLLENSELLTEDIVLRVGTVDLRLHRFMLTARSEYFRSRLLDKWKNKEIVELTVDCDEETFKLTIGYLYLAHDPYKFKRVDHKLLLTYAKKIRLTQMVESLEKHNYIVDPREYSRLMNELQIAVLDSARLDFKRFVENDIIENKLVSESITEEQIKELQSCSALADIIFSVAGEKENFYYPVHRSVLIRDEYFKVMFTSSFSEAQEYEIMEGLQIVDRSHSIHVIHLPVSSPEIAEIVIRFLYYDHTDIPLEHAVDVLFAGDLLLNDKLKTMAAIAITSSPDIPPGYDLYDILRASWETRVDKLEHFVARKIAEDIDAFLLDPEFHEIVLESAKRIQERQETDTIELIDDIRFYLGKKWNIDFEGLFEGQANDIVNQLPGYGQYEMDMGKIETLLSELDLDA
jgi:hypothetical protein